MAERRDKLKGLKELGLYGWTKGTNFLADPEIDSQEAVNQAYDAWLQNVCGIEPIDYIDIVEVDGEVSSEDYDAFWQHNSGNNRMHKKNVFLTAEAQYKLLLCEKSLVSSNGYEGHKSVNAKNGNSIYNFSFMTEGFIIENRVKKRAHFITTVSFELDANNLLNVHNFTMEKLTKLEQLLESNAPGTIDDLADIADIIGDFSIHQYYLPHGIKGQTIDDAYLLFRYDYANDKHINSETQNSKMPPFYRTVYPNEVTAPHFHFTTTFGNLYKQTKDQKTCNFGVGYAIDIEHLKRYLHVLNEGEDFEICKAGNDYGMPFYHRDAKKRKRDECIADYLEKCEKLGEIGEALIAAMQLSGRMVGLDLEALSSSLIFPFSIDNEQDRDYKKEDIQNIKKDRYTYYKEKFGEDEDQKNSGEPRKLSDDEDGFSK